MRKLEADIKHYKMSHRDEANQEQINRCKQTVKDTQSRPSSESLMTYFEFIRSQWFFIQKKWWLYQLILLCLTGLLLITAGSDAYSEKMLGIVGALFIILLIPELWKNQSSKAVEVEQSTYYSLKQVYAARLLIFSGIDAILMVGFCVILKTALKMTFFSLALNLLFPMLVSATICFYILSQYQKYNESIAIMLCSLWNGVWMFFVLFTPFYDFVSSWLLMGLMVMALSVLAYNIMNTLSGTEKMGRTDERCN